MLGRVLLNGSNKKWIYKNGFWDSKFTNSKNFSGNIGDIITIRDETLTINNVPSDCRVFYNLRCGVTYQANIVVDGCQLLNNGTTTWFYMGGIERSSNTTTVRNQGYYIEVREIYIERSVT